jgi:hypothetical protein
MVHFGGTSRVCDELSGPGIPPSASTTSAGPFPGHSGGGEGRRHGKPDMGYPVRVLAAAMAKIEYRGLDLEAPYAKAR